MHTRPPSDPRDRENAGAVCWSGTIRALQCRAWVWRYLVDNRTHHPLGFNLWIEGEAAGQPGKLVVAISELQQRKMQLRIGDTVKGTAWPCENAKHEIANFYRAGSLKVLTRTEKTKEENGPPFVGMAPPLEVFKARGARLLDSRRWRGECMTCLWANKSAVEIEYNFGKTKRYRSETFCYGPKSCPLYSMGEPRPVPYHDRTEHVLDDGALDDCLTGHRGEND